MEFGVTPLRDLPNDHLMTLREAATAIHSSVSSRTLADAIYAKQLASVKIGGKVLVTAGDLKEYVNACRRPAKEQPRAAHSLRQEPAAWALLAPSPSVSAGMEAARRLLELDKEKRRLEREKRGGKRGPTR